jgi:hypothetical protein
MRISMLSRQDWLDLIFESVRPIADRDFQEKAWFGKSHAVSSPDEVYCQLFDDHNFELFLETSRATLTPEQVAAWLDLQAKMDLFAKQYGDYLDPYIVFNDPHWKEVQANASAFLVAFNQPVGVEP